MFLGLENDHIWYSGNFSTEPYLSGLFGNAGPTFQYIVVLQSRGQYPKKMENYRKICPLLSNRIRALSPELESNETSKCWSEFFSNIPDTLCYIEKLPEQNFNVCLVSNPGDKILTLVETNWSQDPREQHKLKCCSS